MIAQHDFFDMYAVRRVELVASSILQGLGLGLAEIYSTPSQVFLLDNRELVEEFALDLGKLVLAVRQGNEMAKRFAEWQALQPIPPMWIVP